MNIESMQTLLTSLDSAGAQRPPKSITSVHYGPDGQSIATRGQAAFSVRSDGGLEVRHDSTDAGGAPHAQSHLQIDAQGRLSQSTTTLFDKSGKTLKSVTGDYGGLSLTSVGTLSSGSVGLAVTDATGRPTHQAEVLYNAETVSHYSAASLDEAGIPTGNTHISYDQAQRVGTRLTGGQLAVQQYDTNSHLSYSAQSYLDPRGLPMLVRGTHFEPGSDAIRGLVDLDYRDVQFNALRAIQAGELAVRARDPEGGSIKSAAAIKFRGGLRVGKRLLEVEEPEEYVPVLGATGGKPWSTSQLPFHCKLIRRADGSLLQKREDWLDASSTMPSHSLVTLYAPDGTTIVRVTDIDYSGATFDSNRTPLAGSIISTHYVAGIRASSICLSY